MAEHHHQYTGGLLLFFTLLSLVAAILFTIAQVRVTEITEFKNGNAKLNSAKNNLIIAYVLAYIATGIGIILAILYFGHVAWGIKNEWPHLIVFLLLFALIIVSGIFAFIALSDISNASPADNKGAPGWIWGGLASLLVSLIVLIISGAWRAQHRASQASTMTSTEKTVTLTAPSELTYEQKMSNAPLTPASYKTPITTAVNYDE